MEGIPPLSRPGFLGQYLLKTLHIDHPPRLLGVVAWKRLMRRAAVEHCAMCQSENVPGARFCNRCGSELPGAAAATDAELKQVTVLFSDLTGYTTLSERLDPEETREIMGRIFHCAADAVERYGGRIEKFIGDALMAIFGVPYAHEDDPVRAVRVALELHRAVAELAPEVEARTGVRIALHSGINTGLVVTGDLRFGGGTAGPVGDTINVAARLMALAEAGEIYVGPVTRRLVADTFALEELGTRALKGKAEPLAVVRIGGEAREADAAWRGHRRSAFVGRQEELGVLLGAVERLRDGEGTTIDIGGEAGTGKTRLLEELRTRLGDDVQWLEGRAYLYAESIPYFPVIDLLSRRWGIVEGDSAAAARAKLDAGIAALVGDSEALFPVVARLYDLSLPGSPVIDGEDFAPRLLEALRRLLVALAARSPTVLCFQDLQWADASTVALLRALIRDPPAPLLFVCNHRPGFALGEGARSFELRELSSRQARELLGSLLEGAKPPEELARFVDARSDGNPFYVEEVVHSLLETHVLRRSEAGWSLDRPLTEAEVPTTIRGVIAARIDRLDEPKRRLLREASVVGREFLHGVIARVTLEPTELTPSLHGLETVHLIRTKTPEPDLQYIFKHALTQEVAYDGLLKSERQRLHERVAFAFEGLVGDRAPEFVETIAYHFLRGGIVDKAVHYAVKAGNKCAARFALDEANVHFRSAFTLLAERARTPAEDRALIALLVDWGFVLYFFGRFGELRGLLEAHEEVAERVEDPELRGMFLAWLGYLLYFAEELPASIEKLELACRLGETSGKTRTIAYAHTWKAFALSWMGRLSESIRAAEAGHALAQALPEDTYLRGWSLGALGLACVAGGDLERARRVARELIDTWNGDPHAAVAGHCLLAQAHVAALEFDDAIAEAQAARGQTRGDPMGRWWPLAYHALGLALALRFQECRPVAVELLALAEEHCAEILATPAKVAGALVSLGEGRLSKGMAALLALHADARTRSLAFNEAWLTFSIGVVYARIATRDVPINIPSLLRNPGFVLRHALPARRKARAWLERVLEASRDSEIKQQDGATHLELATLLARRDPATARTHLERAVAIFERQGAQGALQRARELAVSLGGGATG